MKLYINCQRENAGAAILSEITRELKLADMANTVGGGAVNPVTLPFAPVQKPQGALAPGAAGPLGTLGTFAPWLMGD